jgi:heme exporter protein B
MKPALTIFLKEIRSELRTRYALNALLMFVVTTIAIVLFAVGNEDASPEVLAGVLWVIIFFSSMSGMSRVFVAEEERGTVMTLQLIAEPLTVYFGKLLFNLVLLGALNAVAVTLYLLVIDAFVIRSLGVFVLTVFLGTLGLASASTIIAAIIAKANTRGTLYPVLSFPIMLIRTTQMAVDGATMGEAFEMMRVLIAYAVAITGISYLVFEFIWRD